MLLVRYLGQFFPIEREAKYVLCGETGVTLYDDKENEIEEISYSILISIRSK